MVTLGRLLIVPNMTSITIFNESEGKIIGVCTTHQDPRGGLNRLPLHTKWSDDDYDYYREIFFMPHNSYIVALDHSQLNLKANQSSKVILESFHFMYKTQIGQTCDGQDYKSNNMILWLSRSALAHII